MGAGSILFMNGDNYLFPITYLRIAERMRMDVRLFDRGNIIFKMPGSGAARWHGDVVWQRERSGIERKIIKGCRNRPVFYAVFGPYAVNLPERYKLVPCGIVYALVRKPTAGYPLQFARQWRYYSNRSFQDQFERDFMNREVTAYYYFLRGEGLFLAGEPDRGLFMMKLASEIGYDDTLIHSDMAVFLMTHNFFKEARQELEKALGPEKMAAVADGLTEILALDILDRS
jgi:hypothetical protein